MLTSQYFSHFGTMIRYNIIISYHNAPQSEQSWLLSLLKSLRQDLHRYKLIFLACKYCSSGVGYVITWVSEWSVSGKLNKMVFKIMQCAFNLSNSGILWSSITTMFKIQERPMSGKYFSYLLSLWVLIRSSSSRHYICCGYTLEAPLWGASNEYPQHTVYVLVK